MANSNFFFQQLEIGKSGEAVVAAFFESRGNKVRDVSDDREYQKKDIDFVITNKDGVELTVEVKTDYKLNKSGNLFFESTYHKDWGDTPGWYDYCQADFIVFYDVIGKKLYIYNFSVGRDYVRQAAEHKLFFNCDDGCYREAYLLPLGLAMKKDFCREYDLECA